MKSSILTMFDYFGITGHSGWLDIAYLDIPDSIKQLLLVLTAVNMRKKTTLDVLEARKEQKTKKLKSLKDLIILASMIYITKHNESCIFEIIMHELRVFDHIS